MGWSRRGAQGAEAPRAQCSWHSVAQDALGNVVAVLFAVFSCARIEILLIPTWDG